MVIIDIRGFALEKDRLGRAQRLKTWVSSGYAQNGIFLAAVDGLVRRGY